MGRKPASTLLPTSGLENGMNIIYVYALRDPQTQLICYVGSSGNTQQRLAALLAYGPSTGVQEWIENLRNLRLKPIMEILDQCSSEERDDRESSWIARLLKDGHPLINKMMCPSMTPEEFRQIREGINLSQSDLARWLHYRPETIRLAEAGHATIERAMAQRLRNLAKLMLAKCPMGSPASR